MRLDVQSDLTPLFANWNTKQLYVSIVADWNTTIEGVSHEEFVANLVYIR